jgi:hypothetical protein
LSSTYAVEEARRALEVSEGRRRLDSICGSLEIVAELSRPIDDAMESLLPADDRPILRAAIAGRATQLLSGDLRGFRAHYGARLGGVLVLRPADYPRSR